MRGGCRRWAAARPSSPCSRAQTLEATEGGTEGPGKEATPCRVGRRDSLPQPALRRWVRGDRTAPERLGPPQSKEQAMVVDAGTQTQ